MDALGQELSKVCFSRFWATKKALYNQVLIIVH